MPLMIVTVLMPFYKSADTLSRFCAHPFTIPWTPFHYFADTLSRFRGHPLTILRISSAMPQKNCGFPTRTIRGFRKVSGDKYCIADIHVFNKHAQLCSYVYALLDHATWDVTFCSFSNSSAKLLTMVYSLWATCSCWCVCFLCGLPVCDKACVYSFKLHAQFHRLQLY